jgi:hypothetical protein
VLLLNAFLAFALTVATALTVKYASAMGLILSGVIKDTCIVLFGAYFFREHVTALQVTGFSLQMIGMVAYSLARLYPESFANGFYFGLKAVWSSQVKQPAISTKRYGSVPFGTGSPAGVSFCSWSAACSQYRV